MNWFETLERKKSFALFSIILLVVATIALTSMRDPRTYDGFWHLKMGQDWVEQGLSPWQDHYSFTFEGEEVDSPPVGFQVALFGLVELFGVNGGFKLYMFICMTSVLLLMLWWLHRIKAPVLIYGLVLPLLVALLQFRAIARPELASYTFEIIALILYDRARGGIGLKQMLPIAALMLVWINYHSSIFGYVIFFGLFIDLGMNQLKQKVDLKTWSQWLVWGLLIIALGFVNPSLSHPVIAALTFPEEWKALIQEYQSPLILMKGPSTFVLVFIAVITLILAWRQRLYGYLFVLVFLLANALTMARLVTPVGIVVLCIFAQVSSQLDYRKLLLSRNNFQTVSLPIVALIVFTVPLLHTVHTARVFVAQNLETLGFFPYGMVEYINASGRSGRILNEYELGGFLIYHLAPESKVYIDGRTNILYPLHHHQKFLEVFKSVELLLEETEKYDIQYIVARNSTDKALLLEQTGMFFLDYADVRYFLYSRKDANTPLTGKLWARPYCWTANDQESLQRESLTATLSYSPSSQIHQFLKLLTDYGSSENPSAFIANILDTRYWPDPSRRFVGYQALKMNELTSAIRHFTRVLKKDPKDYLAIALAHLRLGDAPAAEDTLADALSKKWDQLEFFDLVIMHALLTEIDELQAWTRLDDSYIEQLANEIDGHQLGKVGPEELVESFCKSYD